MANISPAEDYGDSVPRSGESRTYTYSFTTGVNSVSDTALSVDLGGSAKAALIYISTADGMTAGTPKAKAHTAAGVTAGTVLPTATGIVDYGSLTSPSYVVACVPRYLSPKIETVTSTAGTTILTMEVKY